MSGFNIASARLFLLIQIVSTLSDRYLGKIGFLGISVLGGLVGSASTSAAAANMVGHGEMRAALAGYSVVLASVASALVNLPIIHRTAKNPRGVATIGDPYGCAKPRWPCLSGPRATLLAFQNMSYALPVTTHSNFIPKALQLLS